jgi:regulator of ribosome biosynthesis
MSSEKNNITIDYGHLLLTDSSPLEKITESKILKTLKSNYINFTNGLFQILKNQIGEDDENRDYDKEKDEIILPKKILTLPRSLPIPKPKQMTKWEKYKKEKGIIQRKRGRMVYSEIAKDWVPRWGKGSIKKIENEANWALEEKEFGINPFDKKNQEKNLVKQKQKMREIKNKIRNSENENNVFNNKKLNNKKKSKSKNRENISLEENDMEKNKSSNFNSNNIKVSKKEKKRIKGEKEIKRLDQDKKNLGRRLEQIQKSTRSMGRFDKRLKNEKELNMIKKRKVDKDILQSRKKEESRNKMIMDGILKNIK